MSRKPMKLENEKQRLTELEAEYERKKNEYGGQMILGQVIELRRIVALLEKEGRQIDSIFHKTFMENE